MPEWYQKSGARRANKPEDKDGKIWSPDSGDPFYIKKWGALVAEAGRRYDGHPYLDGVDISTFGYWGEGWGPYPPDWADPEAAHGPVFRRLQAHPSADQFRRARDACSTPPDAAPAGATTAGATMRPQADFAHMLDRYPEALAHGDLQKVWETAPGVARNLRYPRLVVPRQV